MTATLPAKVTIRKHSRLRRIGWRVGRTLLATYLLVIVVFAAFQSKLIFPGAASQGSPDSVVTPPPGTELLTLTAKDNTRIAALFGRALFTSPADHAKPPFTLIYFYGNGMCLKDSIGEFQQFRQLGTNVLAVEYEGYGMSGGEAGERGCYAAAEAGYAHLLARPDIDRSRIIAAGWSLGGAVAIDLAQRHAGEGHICGVMAFSSFTSMGDVGRYHYPGVPVSLLLRHRFESEEKMGRVGVPILLGHGRRDNIAPWWMMDRLAAAAMKGGLRVTRFTLDSAEHNDFFMADEDRVNKEVENFLKGL